MHTHQPGSPSALCRCSAVVGRRLIRVTDLLCSSATAVERPLCSQCYPTSCSRSDWRVSCTLVQRFRCRSSTKEAAAAAAGIWTSPATPAASSAAAIVHVPRHQHTFTPEGVCARSCMPPLQPLFQGTRRNMQTCMAKSRRPKQNVRASVFCLNPVLSLAISWQWWFVQPTRNSPLGLGGVAH